MQLIVAIGHKARHGKDLFASIFKEIDPIDTYITHWADPLKKEVTNSDRELPLIYRTKVQDIYHYALLNSYKNPHTSYIIKEEQHVPYLHEIFTKRNIEVYTGMDEKDSEILQFWGTDFRRTQDNNYWINKILKEITHRPEKYILIPDTRFRNEYEAVKHMNGIYVKVNRYNKDDTLFLDPSRDPLHPSEVDLNDIPGDLEINAYSEEFDNFRTQALDIIKDIKKGAL